MADPLSIFAAARDAGAAPALRIGERVCSFVELARLTDARLDALRREAAGRTAFALVGANTLETLVTLYALLELRVPALLIHPRLTDAERADLAAIAGRAGPAHADAAAILFTSGTTGTPRGAVLTRAALAASAAASAAVVGWRDDDCWLACMPLARVGGLSIVTRCLVARRCLALAPGFDAHAFPGWIDAQRITIASVVPTMLARVLDAHPQWRPPVALRAIQLGGAMASPRLFERADARGLPILVTYGMTETCSQVCLTPYAARFEAARHGAGLPLPGVELRIGAQGRIEVRAPMLMAGYWDAPPLPAGAWFDTGDLGALDADGSLHVHARRTDLIVTGGENAYPAEIEQALEAYPGIAAAGVFGLPDETWGQTVAAALVADGTPPSDAALAAYVDRALAPHKRPRHLCFVERLPHTPAGKLDRNALPEVAAALRPLNRGDAPRR